MPGGWDPTRVKAQLRLTAQRLGQLQDRKDSIAHITSRDIATLLGQRNVSLARAKAQNLMKEDAMGDALQMLEMYCGSILERFSELESSALKLHPPTIEAAASIIHAAPYTESRDLMLVRELLSHRLGPEFAESATHNTEGHVSLRILRALRYNPSAEELDAYLLKIARTFNVNWQPQMRPDEKVAVLSEMLDASDIMGVVDMQKLRLIASSGIPENPPWLRPRVWKLLFNLVSPAKIHWEAEIRTKRESYYDLVRRLLAQISTQPSTSTDKILLGLIESLALVPANLYSGLEDEPEQSSACPLHEAAPAETKITCASALDARLMAMEDAEEEDAGNTSSHSTPSIVLDVGSPPTSPKKNEFDQGQNQTPSITQVQAPSSQRTVSLSSSSSLSPRAFRKVPAHHQHTSSLLRILFIHSSLNPGHRSPNNASLLIPLYTVLQEEAEPLEVAHAEADTFWLLEALMKEISELDEEDGGIVWMKKFSERLSNVDNELYEDLKLKGLDPALPQYSIRWLSPVLTHTIPLPPLLVAWDSIFAQPDSSRQSNPKLEHLLDICTAMLIRIRSQLFMLGKSGRKSSGLYGEDNTLESRTPLKPWELGNAFMEGMTLLQTYPLRQAGGIEMIVQVAGDILVQREAATKQPQNQGPSLGSKIRDVVWKGFTNQTSSPEVSPDSEEETEEEETESEASHIYGQHEKSDSMTSTSTGSGWTARLKTTVWRGLTNQSALDVPPSPESLSPLPSPTRERSPVPTPAPEKEKPSSTYLSPPSSATSSIWNYAAKLKQSDVAAKLSKVSTNTYAKALDAWSARSAPASDGPSFEKQRNESVTGTPVGKRMAQQEFEGYRRGSVPNLDRTDVYSPPPRPAFFKPPRDSRLFSHDEMQALAATPDSPDSVTSAQSAPSPASHSRTQSFARLAVLPSFSALNPVTPRPTKSAPRPLLLNPSSLVTPSPQNHVTRSANTTPTPQWTDVLRSKVQGPRHKDSISSVSSFQSNTVVSPKSVASGWDSDTSVSRVVPLNRASVSPMAPGIRATRSQRNGSVSSQSERGGPTTARPGLPSSPRDVRYRVSADEESRAVRGWEQVAVPDSPSTLPSSPPPRTPVTSVLLTQSVRVSNPERVRGSVELSEPVVPPLDPAPQSKRAQKKSVSPTSLGGIEDTSDSSVAQVSPSNRTALRLRAKRYGPQSRLSTLHIRDSSPASEQGALSPNTLAAPSFDAEIDLATTPKASDFPIAGSPTDGRTPRRSRKISTEGQEVRTRKISADGRVTRPRKISAASYHRYSESAADEGDDEGYDELLSAYESEEGSRDGHAWSSEA